MRLRVFSAFSAVLVGVGTLALGITPAVAATGSYSDTPNPVPLVVENEKVNRTIPVDLAGTISDIDVTLDFHKVGDWCSNPSGFLSWNNEVNFALVSPSGTSVSLIRSGHLSDDPEENDPDITYPSPWESEHVEVVLDDQAAVQVGNPERTDPNDRYPESGVFHTAGRVLDGLVGEPAAGDWRLEVTNASFGDQLCYYGATLDIETVDPTPAPALTGAHLPGGTVGAEYLQHLPGTNAGPIGSYTLTDPAQLPPGLRLVPDTGAIVGTPLAKGDYSFSITATGPGGVSAPATFTISIGTGAAHALSITPATATVDQGGMIEFVVTATDLEGNPVDITGEYSLSSSVTTDRIEGDRVSFPHASTHIITATHQSTGLTATSTVSVRAVVPPTPSPDTPKQLAATGDPSSAAMWTILLGLLIVGGAAMFIGYRQAKSASAD